MMVMICTTMMLPMMFITMAVVLLLIPRNLFDGRSCIYIYFPSSFTYLAVLWKYVSLSCQSGSVFRTISVNNLTRTVHVHVSSKDVQVWAVAGRQTEAVVQLRKEKLRNSTLVVTPLLRITIQSTTWLMNGNVKTWISKKTLLMHPGLKHLGSGHHGDGTPVNVLLRNGSGERFQHEREQCHRSSSEDRFGTASREFHLFHLLVRSPHKQRRRRAQTQPPRAHRFGAQCVRC